LVKTEIAKFTAGDHVETAQAAMPKSVKLAQLAQASTLKPGAQRPADRQGNSAAADRRQIAQAEMPMQPQPAARQAVAAQAVAPAQPNHAPKELVAFLDTLSSAVDSGDLSTARELTSADLIDYAKRMHAGSPAPVDRPMQTSRL
jgi:hypothetical protein